MSAKLLLGKVFISHSSADKPFVRRLARRIQAQHFGVWLDEHELLPGDRLSEKIAKALQDAKVVLVVVSKASVKSKWLAFELNLAAERMVKGTCRVIPVVIGDVEPPAAVQGLLFADFRRSFANGLKAILTALRYEAKQATRRAGFWAQADDLVEEVFGGRGWVSRLGEFDDRTHDIVSIPNGADGGGTIEVVFDTVSDYLRKKKPVGEGWWSEFTVMRDDFDEDLFLVVSERPVVLENATASGKNGRVKYLVFDKSIVGHEVGHVVFADLSGLRSDRTRAGVLREARQRLIELAQALESSGT